VQHQYDSALWNALAALRIARYFDDSARVADIQSQASVLHARLGEYEASTAAIQEAIEIRSAMHAPEDEIGGLYLNKGVSHYRQSDYRGAVKSYRMGLDFLLQAEKPDSFTLARLENNLAQSYHGWGDYFRARQHYLRALRYVVATDPVQRSRIEPITRLNLGISLQHLGDYAGARNEVQLARQGFAKAFGATHRYVGVAANNEVSILIDYEDYVAARQLLDSTLAWLPPDDPTRGPLYVNYGKVLGLEGDNRLAYNWQRKAFMFKGNRPGTSRKSLALSCYNLAEYAFELDLVDSADFWVRTGLEILAEGQNSASEPGQEGLPRSPLSIEDLVQRFENMPSLPVVGHLYRQATEVLLRQNEARPDPFVAEKLQRALERMLDYAERTARAFQDEGSLLSAADENVGLYEKGILAIAALGDAGRLENPAEAAFRVSEAGRALVLSRLIQAAETQSGLGVPEALRAYESDLGRQVHRKEKAIWDLRTAQPIDSAQLMAAQDEWLDLQTEQERYRLVLAKAFPDYHALKYEVEEVGPEEMRKNWLKPGTAVLAYYLGADRAFGWYLDEGETRMVELSADVDSVRAEVDGFVRRVSSARGGGQYEQNFRAFCRQSRGLYELLVAPLVGAEVPPNLVILPHAELTR
ncbi:MAG: tetratricopeptide repeat protein, partial [Bacteroidota bacterium]